MTRSVLLVGGVPLPSATSVFETVAAELGGLVQRIPDGDQRGWLRAVRTSLLDNPALERGRKVEISVGGVELTLFHLKHGLASSDLTLGPYGYADTAIESFREFRRLRDQGVIAHGTRFQVTMPGPGTSAYMVTLPPDELLPIAREALEREVQKLVENIPNDDLTIQLDIAMEAEHEEYRRRPEAFETPIHEVFDWTLEQMADSVAWLADRIPERVELGFHICSIWHHYQPGGQDNAAIVDEANAILSRISRPVTYIHVPTIPEHGPDDFAAFRDLRLGPGTKLYLGVIHPSDGLADTRRRIAHARDSLPFEFGIASFCGLGNPAMLGLTPAAEDLRTTTYGTSLHRDLRGAAAASVSEVLAMHREAAQEPI